MTESIDGQRFPRIWQLGVQIRVELLTASPYSILRAET